MLPCTRGSKETQAAPPHYLVSQGHAERGIMGSTPMHHGCDVSRGEGESPTRRILSLGVEVEVRMGGERARANKEEREEREGGLGMFVLV